ncbi:MAG: cohesin domain-containing protein [Candidatus Aminicenantia bacterium]
MKKIFLILIIVTICSLIVPSVEAAGGSLYLAPSRGTFFVGSTFSVSIFVDTKDNEINAVQVDLKFPPDILQVTTPTAGESFISEWLTPPSYSNIGGFINFKGGIPEGIVTTAGLISTITFRAKSSGVAKVEFLDSSKILLKDGKGTPIFTTNFGGIYEISVPPPEGPRIRSFTHPDSDIWYPDSNPTFSWEKEKEVTDFSFSFSQNPQEVPDIVSEGFGNSISYSDVSDGIWYFHLRAQKRGIWGRASHFGVKIDTTPPEKFEARIDLPSGFVYFETEDSHSGIDHYEISVSNISETPTPAPFFIEATSPFKIPSKELGKYRIIVRAYDKAGNWQTAETRFQMISPTFSLIEGKGIQIKGILFPWWAIYLILFLLIGGGAYLIFYFLMRRAGFKKGIKEVEEALQAIKKIEEREIEERRLKEKFEEEKEKLEEKLR